MYQDRFVPTFHARIWIFTPILQPSVRFVCAHSFVDLALLEHVEDGQGRHSRTGVEDGGTGIRSFMVIDLKQAGRVLLRAFALPLADQLNPAL